MKKEFIHKELTEKIIKCFYEIWDELGGGFLESVYEKSLSITLKNAGLNHKCQAHLNVLFQNHLVGEFIADIVVNDKVLIEIKAVNQLNKVHEAQLINYLKATGIKIGLLVNFGEKLEFKRRIY
jgi:GxxExxY protein